MGMPAVRSIEQFRSLDHAQRIDALIEIQQRRAALDAQEQRLLAVIGHTYQKPPATFPTDHTAADPPRHAAA